MLVKIPKSEWILDLGHSTESFYVYLIIKHHDTYFDVFKLQFEATFLQKFSENWLFQFKNLCNFFEHWVRDFFIKTKSTLFAWRKILLKKISNSCYKVTFWCLYLEYKSNFAEFLVKNSCKLLLIDFKTCLWMLYFLVLLSHSQKKVQNLKFIFCCRN